MFGFIKEIFVGFLGFGGSLVSDRTKCLSLNNRPCQARPTLVEKDSNELFYHPYTVSVNRCC